eukprot:TRINITY_DN1204_c0_g1_i4.p1 TRINITY_DN1204_c0_g1~~TRINITY_DN1204_c0_g1_i4.p1  ORF type:complete len:566 (+),score=111.37 TRINITY_DN1204_c0_g1_i4:1-1698(+)
MQQIAQARKKQIEQITQEKKTLEDQVKQQNLNLEQAQNELKKQIQTNNDLQKEIQLLRNQMMGETVPEPQNSIELEASCYIEMFNTVFKDDESLSKIIPLNQANPLILFEEIKNGKLLAKLLNKAEENLIDERAINMDAVLTKEQSYENLNLAISGAKSLGCALSTITNEQLYNGNQQAVLKYLWEIFKFQFLSTINLVENNNIFTMKSLHESLDDLAKIQPEQILLRWINKQFTEMGIQKEVTNFETDFNDGIAFILLLNNLEKMYWLQMATPEERCKKAIQSAKDMGVTTFVKSSLITNKSSNFIKLFCAQIFAKLPGLEESKQQEIKLLQEDYTTEQSREERTFRMWINSLALPNSPRLTNLIHELGDGLVLIKLINSISPGIINATKVENNPNHFLKKVSNCNLVIEAAKTMGLSLVGTGGADIAKKNSKLILGLIGQLMRKNLLQTIGIMKEEDLLNWANEKVNNPQFSIKSLKDSSLKNSKFFFHLLHKLHPKLINWQQISELQTEENLKNNAQYFITCARKFGASVFIVWEDIVEVKPNMLLNLLGALKQAEQKRNQQ